MELGAVEVLVPQGGAEQRGTVPAGGHGILAQRGIVGVDKIHESAALQPLHQLSVQISQGIPPHVGHLDLGLVRETAHMGVKHAQALHRTFFGIPTENLKTHTDPQHGAAQ